MTYRCELMMPFDVLLCLSAEEFQPTLSGVFASRLQVWNDWMALGKT